jgi:hypothetical protein
MTAGTALFSSDEVKGIKPARSPLDQGGVMVSDQEYDVAVNPTANDCVCLCVLPKGCVPVDLIVVPDDMDASTGLTFQAGIANAAKTDISADAADGGAAWIASNAGGQTGTAARPTATALWKVTPSTSDRNVAVQFLVAASGAFTAGKIRMILLYRNARFGA